MHINEKGQMAFTLVDGLGDIGIGSMYQRDTLTQKGGAPGTNFLSRPNSFHFHSFGEY